MQKQISSKKTLIMAAAAAIIIIAAAVIVMMLSKNNDFFRSILVYDLEGNAVIERADIGSIDAAENLYLESGDRVSVKEDSMMRMKLDDDKYITAEENTIFSLEAKGDEKDSKTRINLEQGSITNEIQNPLSGESVYETATPNSVMAVRGTIYRAQLYDDGKGGNDMRLCCFKGSVAASPILPDGTLGEEVLVNAGSELTVYSDGTTDGPKNIDFDTLPGQALLTLGEIAGNGTEIEGISKEELDGLISSAGKNDAAADIEGGKTSESETAQDAPEVSKEETDGTDDGKQSESAVKGGDTVKDGNNGKAGSNKKPPQNDKNKTSDKKDENKSGSKDEKQPQGTTPSSGGTSNSGSQDDSSDNGSGDSQDNKSDNGSGSKPKPAKPSKTVTYTVTYKYQGSVFAVQSVKKGDKAAAPVLAPAAQGAWDFNFDTKITADTTIEWK